MLTSHQEASAAGLVATAPAGVPFDSIATPTAPDQMPGMDMPGMDMPESTPAPTGPDEMPGMDMPGMDHGHGDTAGAAVHRPLVPVLGTFGGGSAAVLLTAGMLRRRDRAASLAKKAARAAGRTQK
jgi:uncharacterized protein involved in copper resistance